MDWLSHLLAMMPVSGRLDLRCLYGVPWRIDQAGAAAGAMAYHAVLAGSAVLFAAVHVTVYGLWVLPLDLAAGLLLGWQRRATGSWAVPAVTHAVANLLVVL